MGTVVTISGASDDLVEIEGTAPGCDEYDTEDSHFVLIGAEGNQQVRIRVWFTKRGVWAIAASPVDEDIPMLPVQIGGERYTARATVAHVQAVIREHA